MHRTTPAYLEGIRRRTADAWWRTNQRVATQRSWENPERRKKHADAVRAGNHQRFHVARGIVSPTCALCSAGRVEAAPKEYPSIVAGKMLDPLSAKFLDALPAFARELFFKIQAEFSAYLYHYLQTHPRASEYGISLDHINQFVRDRHYGKELRAAVARGETHYNGKKIHCPNSSEPYVRKYPRSILIPLLHNDVQTFVERWDESEFEPRFTFLHDPSAPELPWFDFPDY